MSFSTKIVFIAVALPVVVYLLRCATDSRSYELERQDKNEADGRYTRTEFNEFMHILANANLNVPAGYNATLAAFDKLPRVPETIMEIGFGLGHFSIMMGEKYKDSTVIGIDAHQLSVDTANGYLNSLPNPPKNVRFETRRESQLNEAPKSVDVITTTFVNHHIFPDEQFVDFLKRVAVIGRQAFIFNDMHRSLQCLVTNDILLNAVKYIGMDAVAQIAGYLPPAMAEGLMMHKDTFRGASQPAIAMFADGGILSMRKSFSMSEYEKMFQLAGYPPGALQCTRLENWNDPTCRVVCVADLTWAK